MVPTSYFSLKRHKIKMTLNTNKVIGTKRGLQAFQDQKQSAPSVAIKLNNMVLWYSLEQWYNVT
jgi:hypothetical protein